MGRLFSSLVLLALLGSATLGQGEKRVTIDLKDTPATEAFAQLFRAAKENFILAPDALPKEQHLTLRLIDIPFEKALNFLCDLLELRWEKREGIYVIQGKGAPWLRFFPFKGRFPETVREAMERVFRELPSLIAIPGLLFCPRCQAPFTPRCLRCRRRVQRDWRFCPYDGTKMPEKLRCPRCGTEGKPFKDIQHRFPTPSPPSKVYTLKGHFTMQVKLEDGDALFTVTPERKITLKVLGAARTVLTQRELVPQKTVKLRLSALVKKTPPLGYYRIQVLDEKGKEIGLLYLSPLQGYSYFVPR